MKKISIFLSFALLLCLLSSCSKTANNDKSSGLNQIGNSSDTDNTHIYGENHTSEFYINNSTETQIYTKQKSTSFAISEEFTWDDYIVYAKKIGAVSISMENYFKAYYFDSEKYMVEHKSSSDYKYDIYENGKAVITEYLGSDNNIVFPDSIDGHLVIGIGKIELKNTEIYKKAVIRNGKINITLGKNTQFVSGDAFDRCTTVLNEITLNEGLKVIFGGTFCLSESIKKINFPSTIIEIGDMAFYDCKKISRVDLSKTRITKISAKCFWDCANLSEVALPDTVRRIELEAFYCDSKLTKINIPAELKEVDTKAFKKTQIDSGVFLNNNIALIDNLTFYNDSATLLSD